MCVQVPTSQKRVSDLPELELQVVARHRQDVDIGNQTQVLLQEQQVSLTSEFSLLPLNLKLLENDMSVTCVCWCVPMVYPQVEARGQLLGAIFPLHFVGTGIELNLACGQAWYSTSSSFIIYFTASVFSPAWCWGLEITKGLLCAVSLITQAIACLVLITGNVSPALNYSQEDPFVLHLSCRCCAQGFFSLCYLQDES